MSDLIPSVNWTDFARLVEEGKIREMKSCEVMLNGDIFTAIIGHGDMYSSSYARTQAEYLAVKSNIVGGKDPAELIIDPYPNLTKAREARKLKKEKDFAIV